MGVTEAENNRPTPVGLYDLDRNMRPVGRAYKQLIKDWREVLPAQSVCLTVPLVLPSEYHEAQGRRYRNRAQKLIAKEAVTTREELELQ